MNSPSAQYILSQAKERPSEDSDSGQKIPLSDNTNKLKDSEEEVKMITNNEGKIYFLFSDKPWHLSYLGHNIDSINSLAD